MTDIDSIMIEKSKSVFESGNKVMKYITLEDGVSQNRKRGFGQCSRCGMLISFADNDLIIDHLKRCKE